MLASTDRRSTSWHCGHDSKIFLKVNVLCQCQLFIRHGARTLKCEFKRLYFAFSSLTSLRVTWEIPRSMTTKIPEASVEDVEVDLQSD